MVKGEIKTLCELLSLRGRRILITGAAMGIGRAMAYRMAEAGADLELVDINRRELKKAKDTILKRFSVEVNTHVVDLSSRKEIAELWNGIDREVDTLVNNAGVYIFKDFLEVDEEFLRKVMDVNLTAAFWMSQEMVKRRKKKGGVIINIGSIEAILPFAQGLVHYDISKMGIIALTRALAREYGSMGYRVNAIIPGGIRTGGVKKLEREAAMKLNINLIKTAINFKSRLPLRRFGEPDEVARMAVVLASELSSYVTGAMIAVDGGFLSS